MAKLSEEEKKEMIEDAKSSKIREDFKKLEKLKYQGFSLEYLEEITKFVKVKYPRQFIKEEKNKL